MNIDDFQQQIESVATHILFDFNGKPCGVDPLSKTEYDVWCGDIGKTVDSVEKVMSIPIFDGQSLSDVFHKITNIEY